MSWWIAVFVLCSMYQFTSSYIINHDKLGLCLLHRLIIFLFHVPPCCVSIVFHVMKVQWWDVWPCTPAWSLIDYLIFCCPFCQSPAQSGHTEQEILWLTWLTSIMVPDWNNSSAKVWQAACRLQWSKHKLELPHLDFQKCRYQWLNLKGMCNKLQIELW